MTKQDEIIEELKKVNLNLTALISRWDEQQTRMLNPKKAISQGVHSPLTPEQAYYDRLGKQGGFSETVRM